MGKLQTAGQDSEIPCVCSSYCKEDLSKMVFRVEEIPTEKALIAYQGASFYSTLFDFYRYINEWAVISIEDEEESLDKYKYDRDAACETEQELDMKADEMRQVLGYLFNVLVAAKDVSRDEFNKVQRYLAEQGNLDILIKLLELIYYKTIPAEERVVAFQLKQKKRIKNEDDEESPEHIAKDYLAAVSDMILRVILMLIKTNRENSERVTKYDHIIYTQLQFNENRVAKIFKEAFKRAQFVYGDKSAVIVNEEGIDSSQLD